MWKLLAICIILSVMGGEAVRRPISRRSAYGYGGGYASSGAAAGGHAGTGVGGGAGHYYDYDDYDFGPGAGAGFIDPYAFHQQLTNQILAQHQATQNAITALATSGGALASADAAILTDDNIRIQHQIAAQQAYNDNLHRQNRYRPASAGSSTYNLHRYAPSYAVASGSIGPQGHHQTAYISPANPDSPNIVNRFGGTSSGGGGGYKGVSVSSFSSSHPDGTSRRGAQTTINDNGKITSYSTHS